MNKFLNEIEKAKSIAIIGHMRPDGDCVGSCLGLYNYILENYNNKNIVVFLEKIPKDFNRFSGAKNIISDATDDIFDLGISLDCGDVDRHGELGIVFKNSRIKICIDHHVSNKGFGDYFYLDKDASSTSEVICRYLDMELISKEAAECFYLGIIHDTGVFKYPSTSSKTMICASKLMEKSINTQEIIDETFYKVTYNQNRLTGKVLLDSKLFINNQVIFGSISKEMFCEFSATKEDVDGIIDKLRVTEGIEVAILVYEIVKNHYKFSLRSISKVNVSKIAEKFGGGGHIRASGFETKKPFEEILDSVLKEIGGSLD